MPSETVSSADLGGSSKYSNENFEGRRGERFQNLVLKLATLPSHRLSSSSRNIVWARRASIGYKHRETRRTAPASQGSSRRHLSHGGGARWCGGYGHVLRRWLNVEVSAVVYAVVSQFPFEFLCRINILLFGCTPIIYSLLFAFIFFHLHNFTFFYPNTKFWK